MTKKKICKTRITRRNVLISAYGLVVFFVLLCPLNGFSQDTITWLKTDFPPVSIPEGKDAGEGIMDKIIDLMISNLPDYHHQSRVANIKRIMTEFEQGQDACAGGFIITEERLKIGHFSKYPSTFLPPVQIVIRREDRKLFESSGIQSLEDLLMNKSLKLGLSSKMAYGKKIDSLVEKYKAKGNIFFRHGDDITKGLLLMLLKNRIDYTISYPWMVEYMLKPEQVDKLTFIPAKETQTPIMHYVMCSKTDWGLRVIEKINAILKKERPTKRYRSIFERWLPKSEIERYRREYEIQFLGTK
ncbi:MAG: TIGR02285 family protein [Nitrospina sp.]|nr:TIGR02285 family protein [Nitrospina sp.]